MLLIFDLIPQMVLFDLGPQTVQIPGRKRNRNNNLLGYSFAMGKADLGYKMQGSKVNFPLACISVAHHYASAKSELSIKPRTKAECGSACSGQ